MLSTGVVLTLCVGVAFAPAAHADETEAVAVATDATEAPAEVVAEPTGAASEPAGVETEAPSVAPTSPSTPAATAGNASAEVRWTAPTSDGATPVTEYVVEAAPSGRTARVAGSQTAATVNNLTNGEATTFTVTAFNAVGSATSKRSASVTPRKPARFVIARQPARRVVYGSQSSVRARLETMGGVGLGNQRVELLAKVRPSTKWQRIAAGTTGSGGGITLAAKLPATAALRLRHPIGAVVADDVNVRSVTVAKRVSVRVRSTRTRIGMPVVVRGRVAPGQAVGSPVRLLRRVSGSWVRAASGRMTTSERYVIRWNPTVARRYVLRVKKSGDTHRAAGLSRRWRHRVDPESAADIARDILRNDRITLATVHVSSGPDGATARQNIVDVANGRQARRSCYGGAPCGSTPLDLRMLRSVREMGRRGTITVSEFAGGRHAGNSAHYAGRAVDITWVNGRHVGWGSSYGMVVDVCRAHGANQVFTPSSDPYGGHSRHVHCAWG